MSRRNDYLDAVALYLAKRSDIGPAEAVRVLAEILALDPDLFPEVKVLEVVQLVSHFYEPESANPPGWLVEARAEEGERESAPSLISVEYVQSSPDSEWVKNALDLWSEEDTPVTTHGLFPGPEWVKEVPGEDFEVLVAWAKSIPGYDFENPPFVRHVEER